MKTIKFIKRYIAEFLLFIALFGVGGISLIYFLDGFIFKYFIFYVLLILFSILMGILLTSRKVLFMGEKSDKEIEDNLLNKRNSFGLFKYDENGFYKNILPGAISINWSEIKQIVLFRLFNYEIDQIVLKIILFDGKIFEINEDTDGWYQFLLNLEKYVPMNEDIFLNILYMTSENRNSNAKIIYEK